jgi:hypothetical protein
MSKNRDMDVIDLTFDSDEEDAKATASSHQLPSIAPSDAAHQLVKKRSSPKDDNNDYHNNGNSLKRQRVPRGSEVIVLTPDEPIESTDVSQALATFTEKHGTTIVTLFSTGARPNATTLFHIKQQDEWSCGFRNLQMVLMNLLSSLPNEHNYFRDRPKQDSLVAAVPTLLEIQHILEQAWECGWDKKGAAHYQWKLVNKMTWIGAVEVATALGFLHIDACVVQFMECQASREKLGWFCKAYFEKQVGCCKCRHMSSRNCATSILHTLTNASNADAPSSPGSSCSCPPVPIYLQWEGHSVTIIGVEITAANVSHLLVLDPMKKCNGALTALANGPLRKLTLDFLMKRNCQVVVCSPEVMSQQEADAMKRATNCITAAPEAVQESMRKRGAL